MKLLFVVVILKTILCVYRCESAGNDSFAPNTSDITKSTTQANVVVTSPTTTVVKTTSVAKVPPKHTSSLKKFVASEFCTCDLLVDSCDVNCCCDKDCSEVDRRAFSKCLPIQLAMQDKRRCYQSDILFRNNSVYKMNRTANGLFCILFDNNQEIRLYEDVRPVATETEFDELVRESPAVLYGDGVRPVRPDDDNMRAGDAICIRETRNKAVFPLGLPASMASPQCEYFRPLSYLNDCRFQCKSDISAAVQSLCASFYFEGFQILRDRPCSAENSQSAIHVRATCYGSDGSRRDCKSPSCNAKSKPYENVVNRVSYVVFHGGVKGLNSVDASIYLTNTSAKTLLQTFEVKYVWKNDTSTSEIFQRSGNPGYVVGKPVLAGHTNKSDNDRVAVILGNDPNRWLTVAVARQDGFCDGSGEMDHRIPVTFGDDITTSCLIPLTPANFSDAYEQTLRHILFGNDFPNSIGMFGNSDPENVDEWIPLINDARYSDGGRSHYVEDLKLKIAYANVGSLSNPQAKIVGAMYGVDRRKITFVCANSDCKTTNVGRAHVFEVKTSVRFIDVTKSPVRQFAGRPVFHARLPGDFFFPIISTGNLAIIDETFFLVLLGVSSLNAISMEYF